MARSWLRSYAMYSWHNEYREAGTSKTWISSISHRTRKDADANAKEFLAQEPIGKYERVGLYNTRTIVDYRYISFVGVPYA